MSADVCVCGHLDSPTHDDGPCRVLTCDCTAFRSEDADVDEAA